MGSTSRNRSWRGWDWTSSRTTARTLSCARATTASTSISRQGPCGVGATTASSRRMRPRRKPTPTLHSWCSPRSRNPSTASLPQHAGGNLLRQRFKELVAHRGCPERHRAEDGILAVVFREFTLYGSCHIHQQSNGSTRLFGSLASWSDFVPIQSNMGRLPVHTNQGHQDNLMFSSFAPIAGVPRGQASKLLYWLHHDVLTALH